jgi:hypothetical protein
MLALGAVQPNWLLVGNHDGVHRPLSRRCAGGNRHEARVDARHVAEHRDGLAWLIECRLAHGVIAGQVLELHSTADGHLNVVGRVGQCSVGTDEDGNGGNAIGILCRGDGGQSCQSEDGELHFEILV